MARPGLYDELLKWNLLDQARAIAMGDGADTDKASQVEVLIAEAGSDFNVSPRAVFILRHRLEAEPKPQTAVKKSKPLSGAQAERVPKTRNAGNGKKPLHPHDGRKDNRPPPPTPQSFFKPGNDVATVTGRHRNALLHGVSEERQKRVAIDGMTPQQMLEDTIENSRLLIMDMTTELEAVKAANTKWVWIGSTYIRQEGDGELAGTFRQAQRKRMPRLEAITRLSKDISAVQRSVNSAVKDLHNMNKGAPPTDANAGMNALAANIKASAELLVKQKQQAQAGGEQP